MSLRDFNTPASDDPTALHHEPLGNGAGLSDFHTVNVEESERSNTPKIVGAVAVALMVGVAAVGLYAYSGPSTKPIKPVVADNTLPKTVPVTPPQQMAMAPDTSTSTPAPDATAPAATPPAPEPASTKAEPTKPAPIHTASARSSHHSKSTSTDTAASETASTASDAASVRMSADTTKTTTEPTQQAEVTSPPAQPAPQQAAQATPLPAAPTPSPSDVASNGGQSSTAVPNNATTASDIPQPQAAPAPAQPPVPAQTTQPDATPAPAPAQ
jgi:hypothetical protein